MDNIFWGDNISVFVGKDTYYKIFPNKKMNSIQKLNSFSRFIIVVSLALVLITRQIKYIQIAIIILIIIYIFYRTQVHGVNTKKPLGSEKRYHANFIDNPYSISPNIDNNYELGFDNYSHRQFCNLPQHKPDSQNEFANWLYKKD